MVPTDLDGKPLEGKNGPPVEWPIHTAIHSARADASAVARIPPYPPRNSFRHRQTAISPCHSARRDLQRWRSVVPGGSADHHAASCGSSLLKVIGDKRAALLRGHGIVVVGQNLQEVLYTSLVLEDDTKKTLQAVGDWGKIGKTSPEECRAFGAEIAL